jgi:hypothetical protein
LHTCVSVKMINDREDIAQRGRNCIPLRMIRDGAYISVIKDIIIAKAVRIVKFA